MNDGRQKRTCQQNGQRKDRRVEADGDDRYAPLLQHDGCQGDHQADAQTDRTRAGNDREKKTRIGQRGPNHLYAVSCVFE